MRSGMMRLVGVIGILVVALGLVASCAQGPNTVPPEEFYRGKTLTWVVSSGSPGGQDDLLSRAVVPHLARETGATVKVEVMGTDEGVNWVYNEAKRDGLTMVTKSTNAVISNDILKAPGTLYEVDKLIYIADVYPYTELLQVSPKSPYKTIEALRQAKGLKAGGTTVKGALATAGAVMIEILGLDGKVITGFNGKKDLTLAIARGEIDFLAGSDTTALADERDGYLITVATVSDKRSPVAPNVPTLVEMGIKIPKELEAAHQYISAGGFGTALPPDVQRDKVEYLRKVFQKLSDDKGVQEAIKSVTGDPRPFIKGEELQKQVAAVKANKGLAEQLDALLTKHKAVK